MSSMGPADPGFELLGGVLRRVTEVIGPGAAYSMMHYAAVQEGQRLALGASDLALALGRIDEALGIRTRIVEDRSGRIVLRLEPVVPPVFNDRGVQGLVLGLFEGAITAGLRRPYRSLAVGELKVNGGPLVLEFGSGQA
jgi:hypothetical protein